MSAPRIRPASQQRAAVDEREHEDDRRRDQPLLDDHLDVHQPVTDDGRGERERNAAEQHGGVRAVRRHAAEEQRHDVQHHERHRADRRSPDDPAQLAPRGHRAQPRQRADHDEETAEQADGQIEIRGPLDPLENERHVRHRQAAGHDERAADAEHRGGHVDAAAGAVVPTGAANPRLRALGKHEREVQEERRQDEPRHQVGPLEEVVEPIVAAARRERQHAEERDGQPEEVQRRRIVRAPQPDRRADHDREDADERQRVVQARDDAWRRLKLEVEAEVCRAATDFVRESSALRVSRG